MLLEIHAHGLIQLRHFQLRLHIVIRTAPAAFLRAEDQGNQEAVSCFCPCQNTEHKICHGRHIRLTGGYAGIIVFTVLDTVEAGNQDILGDAQAPLCQNSRSSDRHRVICAADRFRNRQSAVQKLVDRRSSRLLPEISVPDLFLAVGYSVSLHLPSIHLDSVVGILIVPYAGKHENIPAMMVLNQMPHAFRKSLPVIGVDGNHALNTCDTGRFSVIEEHGNVLALSHLNDLFDHIQIRYRLCMNEIRSHIHTVRERINIRRRR